MRKRWYFTVPVVIAAAVIAGWLAITNAAKASRYKEAKRLLEVGDQAGAYCLFQLLGDYRDAEDQAKYLVSQDALLPCRGVEKYDIVPFGRIEQDNDPGNGPEPIDWIVLDKIEGRLLLLSSSCLLGKAYNEESFAPVTWETCSLRKWLNNEFLNSSFSEDERKAIPEVLNRNEDHSMVETPGGKDTRDRVFLLSESDTVIYLHNPDDQEYIGKAFGTDYAASNGLLSDDDGFCSWWLRSPGMYEYIAQYVDQQGKPNSNGGSTDIDYYFGVRPAIWLDPGQESEGAGK